MAPQQYSNPFLSLHRVDFILITFSNMNSLPSANVSVLVVDAGMENSAIVSLLSKAKYKVMLLNKGEDALSILQKQPGLGLVVAGKLTDMCTFQFVRIVGEQIGLPVLMICDTDDESSIVRGLQCGAMHCLVKPVCLRDVERLWQYIIVRNRELMQDCVQQSMTASPNVEPVAREFFVLPPGNGSVMHESMSGSERHRKRKINEVGGADDFFLGQSSASFTWTPGLQNRFLCVVRALGLFKATPSEIVRHINAPGLTTCIVAEVLQELFSCLQEQIEARFEMVASEWDANFTASDTDEEQSPLMACMQNPHFRAQLKSVVQGAIAEWHAIKNSGMVINPLAGHPHGAPVTLPQVAVPQFALPQFAVPPFVLSQVAMAPYALPHFAGPPFVLPQVAVPPFTVPPEVAVPPAGPPVALPVGLARAFELFMLASLSKTRLPPSLKEPVPIPMLDEDGYVVGPDTLHVLDIGEMLDCINSVTD